MHIHILCYPLRTAISKITNKYFLDDINTHCFADIGGFDEHQNTKIEEEQTT